MAEETRQVEIMTYICDLCGNKEHTQPDEMAATRRIIVQELGSDGSVDYLRRSVTLDVCALCQSTYGPKRGGKRIADLIEAAENVEVPDPA